MTRRGIVTRGNGAYWFVDESKRSAYILAAVPVEPDLITATRTAMRSLCHRGSSEIHMKSEGSRHRRFVLTSLCEMGLAAHVIVSRSGNERDRRRQCLETLYRQAGSHGAGKLVLESDESIQQWDRQAMYAIARAAAGPTLAYEWTRRREEPLLWAADAIAWAYARGGEWRARVNGLITVTAAQSR